MDNDDDDAQFIPSFIILDSERLIWTYYDGLLNIIICKYYT